MHLQTLTLTHFRSYPALTISFPPAGALLEGLNGVGKTNILEGIHILCTGRSQRGASRSEMIAHGQDAAFLEGVFCPPDPSILPIQPNPPTLNSNSNGNGNINSTAVTASLGFSRDKKVAMKIDGLPVGTYSEWFGERPIVSFGTDDLMLVYGAPEGRRKFLDMLISQVDRAYLEALSSYRRAMACRNALFGLRADPAQFEIYEQAMAASASKIVSRRAAAILELRPALGEIYGSISGQSEGADLEYLQKLKCDFSCASGWQNIYLETLAERRLRDAELMYTGVGPHRDDLRFLLGGHAARAYASQGQCRSFALALKLASVRLIERHRGGAMIFLVDDAVSELDPLRTSRAYPLLEGRGQIFIATPKCQVGLSGEILRCTVEDGLVTIAG